MLLISIHVKTHDISMAIFNVSLPAKWIHRLGNPLANRADFHGNRIHQIAHLSIFYRI